MSAGKPIHGVEIEIRDPATGEPVATGEPGEIWVRSEQLMSGYWGKPEATAAAITPTAGCAPATAATSTPTATSTSPTASRT